MHYWQHWLFGEAHWACGLAEDDKEKPKYALILEDIAKSELDRLDRQPGKRPIRRGHRFIRLRVRG